VKKDHTAFGILRRVYDCREEEKRGRLLQNGRGEARLNIGCLSGKVSSTLLRSRKKKERERLGMLGGGKTKPEKF